eukprot:UN01886
MGWERGILLQCDNLRGGLHLLRKKKITFSPPQIFSDFKSQKFFRFAPHPRHKIAKLLKIFRKS